MPQNGPGQVVVIGAGIIGACTAHALLDAGRQVTLVDPDRPGGAQAASYGNGGFLSPASSIPMSVPGLWRRVPGYLLDPSGPLTIRWRHLPRLAPWLIRFLRAGATQTRLHRTAGILAGLVGDGAARHMALAGSAGCPELIRQDGLIYAYETRAEFDDEAAFWQLRRYNGLRWRELSDEALWDFEPALRPLHRFAAVVDDGAHCTDPGAYVAALVGAAERRGARLVRARATGFTCSDGHLRAVRTNEGEQPCTAAVIAAGIDSADLAAQLGDAVPLVSERGYHVELPTGPGAPRRPVMPGRGKMANLPTRTGLRAAGQVELASTDAPPDWRRADILLDTLRRTYPDLTIDPSQVRRWYGHRPSTPDGLPVIGQATATPDVIHAFGHGHSGLVAAPITGAIVAALIGGTPPPLDPAPFAPARFR
ncbi:NAD(P)/FAD-dependent oxidoreductase [Allosediminivita pacifica]|uniref:Glycine/D-amino acid oxidase-like deaminating enzyme n=1 Tax=Allosediminivita pacifica TaxID=1267769 RepID=A0A2T6AS80_9RHOB|nr:FAD-binding oxidoreductase [Allosediminivita pacifica]PTX46679.1 glycine/D-amino acid oxidase-like deaminating enzyme [Allosediminivita pacifica]GGB16004.1 dehydrogenase [Allosediminivita pacifica]